MVYLPFSVSSVLESFSGETTEDQPTDDLLSSPGRDGNFFDGLYLLGSNPNIDWNFIAEDHFYTFLQGDADYASDSGELEVVVLE